MSYKEWRGTIARVLWRSARFTGISSRSRHIPRESLTLISLWAAIKTLHMLPELVQPLEWFIFMQTPYTRDLDSPVCGINSWSCTNPLIS